MRQRDREGTEEEMGNRCWRDSWEPASAQISPEASSHKRVAFSSSMSLEKICIAVTGDHSSLTYNDKVTGSSLTAPSRGFKKKKKPQ